MKKIVLMFVASSMLIACNSKKTSEEAKEVAVPTETSLNYIVNTDASAVNWSAAKVTKTHNGEVAISEGSFQTEAGKLVAGNFTIDMTSINDRDLEGAYKTKFETHIKGADFFHTDSFKTAKFEITKVEELTGDANHTHTITGNLTIKDKTNSISFPAKVNMVDDKINALAKIEINRNEWNIIWGGSKETNKDVLTKLKDDLIKDMITFDVNIEASK